MVSTCAVLEISRRLAMDILDSEMVVDGEEIICFAETKERNLDTRASCLVNSRQGKVARVFF